MKDVQDFVHSRRSELPLVLFPVSLFGAHVNAVGLRRRGQVWPPVCCSSLKSGSELAQLQGSQKSRSKCAHESPTLKHFQRPAPKFRAWTDRFKKRTRPGPCPRGVSLRCPPSHSLLVVLARVHCMMFSLLLCGCGSCRQLFPTQPPTRSSSGAKSGSVRPAGSCRRSCSPHQRPPTPEQEVQTVPCHQ